MALYVMISDSGDALIFFPNEVVRKQVKQHRIRLTTVFIMVPFVAFDNHKSQADPLIYYSA